MPFASRAPFRRPTALLLGGAVLAGFLGLGSATMVLAAPRYIAVCPTGGDGSCATVSTEETHAELSSAETAVVPLGGADSSSLTLSNNNASGSATLTVIGSFDSANPSTAASVFAAAAKTAIRTTIAIRSGESRVIRVPDLPTGAKSVLVRLTPAGRDGAAAADSSDERAVASVDIATGGSSISARDVRSALEKLRALRASASPTPTATSEPRENESRIDDVVDEVLTETAKPAPPTEKDETASAAPGEAEQRSTAAESTAKKAPSPAAKKTSAEKPAAGAAAKPTAKPSPKPAAAPKPAAKPAPKPAAKPTPATPRQDGGAGVPAGTRLTRISGDVVVTAAGTVLDSKDIHGRVIIKAPNVTIKNSVIRGADSGSKWGLIDALAGHPGLRVLDSEIVATTPNHTVNGIMGFNFELNRVNIHGVIDQVHVTGGNVTIANSWLHDNVHYENDPSHSDGSHDDNVQIQKGDGISITNNLMTNAHNAAVQITQDAGRVSNVTITGNRADHGGCTVNIAEKGRGAIQGIRIADNIFGRGTKHANCAVIAPTSTKVSLGNNTYTDGAPVSVRKGG